MRPHRVHVPHFVCDSVTLPMQVSGTSVTRYRIGDDLLPVELPALRSNEMLLMIDYFGLCGKSIAEVASVWGDRCIVDRSQAFFSGPVAGCWTFNSSRKFFGVPDGAQLWGPKSVPPPERRFLRPVIDHLLLGLAGAQAEGLPYHRANDANLPLDHLRASLVSERLLERGARDDVRRIRERNFKLLHALLGRLNMLDIGSEPVPGPFHYPLLLPAPIDHRMFHAAGIFCPVLWPEVLTRPGVPGEDADRVKRLLALPLDQRYDERHMEALADTVLLMLDQ